MHRYARRVSNLRPVVLSGGSGTRLWPLSTPELPKQFVRLFAGRSLFGMTLERLEGIEGAGAPIVVTGASHVDLVAAALGEGSAGGSQIIVEPTGRNTAPAAIAAAMVADPGDILVIVPSDHLLSDVDGFRSAVGRASGQAEEGGIVTFGIEPTRPETGYGYIEMGESRGPGAFEVRRFKEKPDEGAAREMVADGRHVWNSGMFVARSDHFLEEAGTHCPDIVDGVRGALPSDEARVHRLAESFGDVVASSIDYAIMEQTHRAVVIPIDVGWDDVGSYRSLLGAVARDTDGNHIEGEVTTSDVNGSLVWSTSRRVVVAGMKDVAVVETPDGVLVVPLDRSQEVRELARRVDRG